MYYLSWLVTFVLTGSMIELISCYPVEPTPAPGKEYCFTKRTTMTANALIVTQKLFC